MEILQSIVSYISGLFQSSAVFLALIALVGLLIQRKSFNDVVKGTFKTMLGCFVLLIGVDVMQGSIGLLASAFGSMVHTTGGELADYGVFLDSHGAEIGMVMVIGFILNLVIARFTPLKTVYLTGHMMMFFAMLWLGMSTGFGLTGVPRMAFAIVGYLLSITITPQLLLKDMKFLTGKQEFTVGHSGTFWCLIAARVGQLSKKLSKKESPSMEHLKFPKQLDFLRDTTLTTGILMVIIYAIVALMLPADVRAELCGDDVFTTVLTQGMRFGAGILILLQGCRMMMGELVPAFTGISNKLVPGAVPALDIPMIYPYGPTSLMIGFLVALVSSLVTMFVINFSGLSAFVLVPITAAVYFDVASGSVFANAYGGRRGVILWGIIGGVGIMVVTALAMPLVASTVGTFVQQQGFTECSVWIIIVGYIARLFGLGG